MQRRNELDALRGIFLLLMAGVHLPTVVNGFASEPLGYADAAEGFVFLSAFLVGSIYTPLMFQRGIAYVRDRLWKRARKLYGYHLLLLLFLFVIVATVATITRSIALHNYLLVFFSHPVWAVASSPFFVYQPPLLDILPMYIMFLLASPLLLRYASRRGWRAVLVASGLLWLFAQLGGGRALYELAARAGVPLERAAFGAFDWYAWQLVWVTGLWLGYSQHRGGGAETLKRWFRHPAVWGTAVATSIFFLLWRHHVGGLLANVGTGSPLLNKWRLGPLRLLDCVALGWILTWGLLPVLRWLRVRVLELLGRNSLQVFCAHIPVCVLGDALAGRHDRPPGPLTQTLLWVLMLGVMLFVARRAESGRNRGSPGGAGRTRLPRPRAPLATAGEAQQGR